VAAVVIIEAVVIVLLLVLVAGLLKSHAEILRRLDQLGSASDAPTRAQQLRTTGLGKAPTDEISGVDPVGSAVSVSLEHGRGETLLSFLSTGCASCRVFWDELAGPANLPTPSTRPVIVTKGPQAESPAKVADLAPGGVQVVMSDEAWDTFRVPVTPYFMLVDGHGDVIGEGSATKMSHLLGLFRQSAADSNPVRLSTRARERFTDDQLSSSGIEPGDPSLYEDPSRE
jgi:hypothetical protein